MTATYIRSLTPLLDTAVTGNAEQAYRSHRLRFAAPPPVGAAVGARIIELVEQSGLTGRGGAGFPTARKMKAVVREHKRSVVVVNGNEGEPTSFKDSYLLEHSTHLVLDGAVWAALSVGATEIVVCMENTNAPVIKAVSDAIAIRRRHGEKVSFKIDPVPSRFVAGQATATVNWINKRDARPTLPSPRTSEKGVAGKPTLVDNVETLADVALIAVNGPAAFRASGVPDAPGTFLTTISGAVSKPGIYEARSGRSLRSLVEAAGGDLGSARAVLVGGYFGSWLTPSEAARASLSDASLAEFGAHVGCGSIVVLPESACGVLEAARVLKWTAGESAGQCGMCVNGLASVAEMASQVYFGRADDNALHWLLRWADQIEGRGACKLPDGAMGFMRSALRVFGDDFEQHRLGSPCVASANAPMLPLPRALEGGR